MNAPVRLRSFVPADLPALVHFWNATFVGQRNFRALREVDFRARVLESPYFEPGGLILAWSTEQPHQGQGALLGLAHAFRPQAAGVNGWSGTQPHHALALLAVRPDRRRQGIGGRLLRATEEWLHYCPVYVGGLDQPCYGTLEQFEAPFFGSSERLGLSARATETIGFLSRRGYRVFGAGDVSMTLRLDTHAPTASIAPASPPAAQSTGLRLVRGGTGQPFAGRITGMRHWFEKETGRGERPYHSLLLVDFAQRAEGELVGGVIWYPVESGRCALSGFWLQPELRGRALGSWLLDSALQAMATWPSPAGGYAEVELHTHLTHYPRAVQMYERRGFVVDELWVNLEKT